MSHEIIPLRVEDGNGIPAPGLLNWKLNDVLLSSSSAAVIAFPSAGDLDPSLLEFLAEWSDRYEKAKKRLYLLAEGPGRAERLRCSRRGRALHCLASVAELEKTVSARDGLDAGRCRTAGTMAAGATVTAAAEYACLACGKTRMWLKGDTAAACDNLECGDAQAGWRMTFELF